MKKTLKIRLFLNIGIIIDCILAVIIMLTLLFCTELPIWACFLIALSPGVLFLIIIWATRRLYFFFAILEPDFCPYCGYDLDADEPTPEERLSSGQDTAEENKTGAENQTDL